MSDVDPWNSQPFRIVIEGVVPDHYLPELLDGIRKITPVDGGFTFSVGTHTDHADRSIDPCPEWHCPDLSAEDRRDGKTCPEHPCTCAPVHANGGL